MNPKIKMKVLTPCENCRKVKELEAIIKDLDALISWIETKAFEYEDEAYRLRKQLKGELN